MHILEFQISGNDQWLVSFPPNICYLVYLEGVENTKFTEPTPFQINSICEKSVVGAPAYSSTLAEMEEMFSGMVDLKFYLVYSAPGIRIKTFCK